MLEDQTKNEFIGRHLVFYLSNGNEVYGRATRWGTTIVTVQTDAGLSESIQAIKIIAVEKAEWGFAPSLR